MKLPKFEKRRRAVRAEESADKEYIHYVQNRHIDLGDHGQEDRFCLTEPRPV
jgi:hypothetical protein